MYVFVYLHQYVYIYIYTHIRMIYIYIYIVHVSIFVFLVSGPIVSLRVFEANIDGSHSDFRDCLESSFGIPKNIQKPRKTASIFNCN